jgi:hypothetical protein
LPRMVWNCDLLISVSQIARITGISYQHSATFVIILAQISVPLFKNLVLFLQLAFPKWCLMWFISDCFFGVSAHLSSNGLEVSGLML